MSDEECTSSSRPKGSMRTPITDLSQWLERCSVMVAILTMRFFMKAPERMAYQASIVRAEKNYEGRNGWCMTASTGEWPWPLRT